MSNELCDVCGLPDNCGDCNHAGLPVGFRLPTTPGESDYPKDVIVSLGYNGDEVYGTVLFTGVPVGIVSYHESNIIASVTGTNIPPGDYKWDHLIVEGENWDWAQIWANFMVSIGEANEDFVEEVMERGLPDAYDSENAGEGHALVSFTQEVAECMYKAYPDLCADPHARGSGW